MLLSTSFIMDSSVLRNLFVVLTLGLCLSISPEATPTYEDRDPISGRPVQCDRCPPGTFLRATCSSVKKSECSACPQGSFTELWNYIGRCLRCGVCGRNQVVKKECTADSDCQCECREGYFYDQRYEMCYQHAECSPGHGVLTQGTLEKNTVCYPCPQGTFSDISSAHQNCTNHKNCSEAGLQCVLKGSTWHDSVCANCEELKDETEYLKEIIPSFFIFHKMNIKRLRRIVKKLPSEDCKKPGENLELSFSKLHARICEWKSSATAAHIQQLPDIISKVGETTIGEKLQNKLNHIQTFLKERCPSKMNSD